MNRLLIILVSLVLASCFPMRFTDLPGASGRIIDARTEKPVANAKITLTLQNPGEKNGPIMATTDEDGKFLIKPKKSWGIYIVPMDFVGYFGKISIDAVGYSPVQKDLRSSPTGPDIIKYGDIKIQSQ